MLCCENMHGMKSVIVCILLWSIVVIFVHGRSWSGNIDNRLERNLNYSYSIVNDSKPTISDKEQTVVESYMRRERQTDARYTIELFMVVDYAAYKWWYGLAEGDTDRETHTLALINQYYSFVFNGIDLRFRSIDDQPFQIDIGLVGIHVAKSENESEWTSGSTVENGGVVKGERLMVNSSEALEKFQTWIDENEDLPKFDHAVLFTGTNLTYAGSPGNTGLAFASSMCRNISNSSIVEDLFDFRTITYASQQIARSLGASDDMDNNDCLEFFNYIMTPKLKLPMKKFPSNRWTFSTCSLTYFQEYLDTLNEDQINCLLDTTLSEKYPPDLAALTEELQGQLYSADQQCVHAYGRGSFVCRNEIKNKYASVCYGLPCYVLDHETCKLILPADGTPCGNKKYCMKGKCSTTEDADKLPDTCPYGNRPSANCSGVNLMPSVCYLPIIFYDCCNSCLNVSLPKKGCEYGDRISSCTPEDCLERGGEYSSVTCCLTCEGISTTTPSSTSQGMSPVPPTSAQTIAAAKEETTTALPTIRTGRPTAELSSTTSDIPQLAETSIESSLRITTGSDDLTNIDITESSTTESMSIGDEITLKPSDAKMESVFTEEFHTIPRTKRSSPMVFTRTVLKTADPIQSPATVKPVLPNGYQAFVNNGMKSTTPAGLGTPLYSISSKNQVTVDVATDSYDTSTSRSTLTEINASIKPLVETTASVVVGAISSTRAPKTSAAEVTVEPTERLSTIASTTTGAGLPTTAKTTSIPSEWPSSNTQQMSPSTTTCPTPPEKDWDRNLSLLNRQFFSKLAITMRTQQKLILYEAYRKLQHMYKDITTIFKERKDAEDLMGSNSDSPSFDNSDILQLIGPIWRKDQKAMLIALSTKIKKLRYKVLAMTKNYLTWQTKK